MGPQYWLMLLLMALKMDYCNGHQFSSCLCTIFLFFPLIFCYVCFVSCPFFPFVSGRKTATRICPEKHAPLAMYNDISVCVCVRVSVCDVFTHRKFSPFNARISRHFTLVNCVGAAFRRISHCCSTFGSDVYNESNPHQKKGTPQMIFEQQKIGA